MEKYLIIPSLILFGFIVLVICFTLEIWAIINLPMERIFLTALMWAFVGCVLQIVVIVKYNPNE